MGQSPIPEAVLSKAVNAVNFDQSELVREAAYQRNSAATLNRLGIHSNRPFIVYVSVNGCSSDGGPHSYPNISQIQRTLNIPAFVISLDPEMERHIKNAGRTIVDNNNSPAPGELVIAPSEGAAFRAAGELGLFANRSNRFQHSGFLLLYSSEGNLIARAQSRNDPAQTIQNFRSAYQEYRRGAQRST